MKKKTISIVISLVVLTLLLGAGIYVYFSMNKPNETDIHTTVAPNVTKAPTPLPGFTAIEPQYKDVTANAYSMYPTLSGNYEKIWDDYENIPIDIVAFGDDSQKAYYKMIWSKTHLYVQVTVYDDTPDVSAAKVNNQDGIKVFINEDGSRGTALHTGDAYYAVNRENKLVIGPGGTEDVRSTAYPLMEAGKEVGYIAELAIPFITKRPNKLDVMGFEVSVNNANAGNRISVRKWASASTNNEENFSTLGLIVYK